MGGDQAPRSVVEGAEISLKKLKLNNEFLIFGNENKIAPIVETLPLLSKVSHIVHTEQLISPDEKPSIAFRKGKNSSMGLAINAVKTGKADAVVSGGNTGALMTMAKLALRPLAGIDRPAIASVFPTRRGKCVLLDMGANIDCNADNLVQFAIMGDAFAKVLLNLKKPTIGLLNVGSEENKGSEIVKAAAEELRDGEYPLDFYGYVEGDDLAKGTTDVVVTDGFTGNIALKTAEGTAKLCGDYVKKALIGSPLAMLGGVFVRGALKRAFKKMDPRLHNGAMFLGLNGIAVKSHGGSDAIGFSNAIMVAHELAANNINEKISSELAIFDEENGHSHSEYHSEYVEG